MQIRQMARAKVNLFLHVTGRRADGYHLLDSLVVFADIGDALSADLYGDMSLKIVGPFADQVPSGDDNLVLQAAQLACPKGQTMAITLDKQLPVAAGIGGGSADAAAILRIITAIYDVRLGQDALLSLGADVPVCLSQRPQMMRGIGEVLSDAPDLPETWMVLVNNGRSVSTAQVFQALSSYDSGAVEVPGGMDFHAFADWLGAQRNDLEVAAIAFEPGIGDVLELIDRQEGCALARMSGSGGTCFGLFAQEDQARAAASILSLAQPDWWVRACKISNDTGDDEIGE
jgi:4-diphosphocytidyl-2-C-methyl-D-erythritol kinase